MNNKTCDHDPSLACLNCTHTDPNGVAHQLNGEYIPDLRYYEVIDDLRRLTGQILTTLEATIDNEKKLKATKDIMRGYMSQTMEILWTRTPQGKIHPSNPLLAISPEL